MEKADKAIIEAYMGGLSGGRLTDAEDRLARLGRAEVVALEMMMVQRGEFIRHAASVRSEGDAVDHRENLKATERMIGELSRVCGDIPNLTEPAQEVVDRSTVIDAPAEREYVGTFDQTPVNIRPG